MPHSSLSRMACCLIILSSAGCTGRQPASDKAQAAKDAVAAIAAGQDPASITTDRDSPFTHEIDHIPEGLRYRQATRALDQGDMKTVEAIGQELASSPKYSALSQALHGLVLIRQGKLDDAIGVAEDISAIPVMQPEAYVIAGEVFRQQNRLNEAEAAFENALSINPQHIRAHRWLGVICYDTGSMRRAIEHLRTVAKLEPSDSNSLLLSGKINQEYEQYEEAVRDYEMATPRISDANLKVFVAVKQAECLVWLRKLDAARNALASSPTTPAVVATRATISEAEGKFDEAAQLAKEALSHSPKQRVAALVLGRIYVTQNNWQAACELLDPVVSDNPFDHECRLLLGRALVGSGDKERGQTVIKEATQLKDDVLLFAKMHQEAMDRPADAQVRLQLGQMARKLGRKDLAKSWYTAALGLDQNLEGAKSALKELETDQ